ncbi:MAG: signal peptidase I [Acidobacteria bacterium]|nr:signal peptidase I [Acidobacteriota bacterium]
MSEESNEPVKSKKVAPPKSTFREYMESFVVTLIMAIFGMTFVIQAVTVPTGSMQNTILIGDYLLVNKFVFAPGGKPVPLLPQKEIERGDIIVFKYPGNKVNPAGDRAHGITAYQVNYVKRVIGLPGETVEFRGNQVYINGELLPENRLVADDATDTTEVPTKVIDTNENAKWSVMYDADEVARVAKGGTGVVPTMNFGVAGKEMKVPEDSYFVMGDNRNNSEDSRFWGFVNRDLVIGRAMFVYWSCDRKASSDSMLGCVTHPRLSRIGKMIK